MILILGKTGYLAQELISLLIEKNVNYIALSKLETNYYDTNILKNFIRKNNIKVLINCAGFIGKPSVDVAEIKKQETLNGNLILPILLTEVCKDTDIKFVHISTGCIYQGDNNKKGWAEEDTPNFTLNSGSSFYSGIKWEAEKIVRTYEKHYICRLRMPFNSINDSRNLITKLRNYEFIWNDWNSFTEKREFVDTLYNLFSQNHEYGTYNICNPNPIWTKDIISLIQKYIDTNKYFKYFNNLDEFFTKNTAPRSNCIMNTTKLKNIGLELSDSFKAMEVACRNYEKN